MNDISKSSLHRVLGVPSLVLFGLAYMVPLTIFTTYGVVTTITKGHLPVAYIVTLFAMFFTALSYGSMVNKQPTAGSAYSYASKAFGSSVGFMVGWTLLLDYIFLPLINFLLIGIFLHEYFPAISAHIWIIASIALATIFNILGIKLVAKMNFIIVGAQAIFLIVFFALTFAMVLKGDAPSIISPFIGDDLKLNSIVAGAAILCLSFLGFDAISTLSEEAHNPRRSVPIAIIFCTLIAGLLFIITAWAGHLVFPNWQDFKNEDTAATDVMARLGGHFLVTFFTAAYIAGAFASAMASQVSVVRILYSMGRDNMLPNRIFGVISKKFGTPIGATLVVSLVSLLALVMSVTFAVNMISFGALAAFSFVNLSVIKVLFIDQKQNKGSKLIIYGVLPFIGFLFTLWLWTSLSSITFIIGMIWFAIGFIYLLYLTRFFKIKPKEFNMEDE
ncbi:APC family permease [Bartonella sp. HY406]|uniref:APC family permease n=1 Tax=Bartonella sp. HY406 TaxID=2979331 RepID=UPI0021C8648B|nr:APC family permease [Bartonella sp. HY406]UXN02776.1 APC family permease [Bartonella sp. HY406]